MDIFTFFRLLQSSNFQIPRYHRTHYQTTPFLQDGSRNIHTLRERYQMSNQPPEDSSNIHNCIEYSDQPFDTCDKFVFSNELQQQLVTTTAANHHRDRRSNQFISTTTQTIPFEESETEDRLGYKRQILNGRRIDKRGKLKNIQVNIPFSQFYYNYKYYGMNIFPINLQEGNFQLANEFIA